MNFTLELDGPPLVTSPWNPKGFQGDYLRDLKGPSNFRPFGNIIYKGFFHFTKGSETVNPKETASCILFVGFPSNLRFVYSIIFNAAYFTSQCVLIPFIVSTERLSEAPLTELEVMDVSEN